MTGTSYEIPEPLKISFYHEALAYFILEYADIAIINELVKALQNNNLVQKLDEIHVFNDYFEIRFAGGDRHWFNYHNSVKTLSEKYGVSMKFVISNVLSIISAIGGNQSASVSRFWSLFVTKPKDLVHLKLINSDLYHWRQSMIETWTGNLSKSGM